MILGCASHAMFSVLIMHSELSVSLWFVHFDIFKNLVSKLVFDVIWRPAVLVVVAMFHVRKSLDTDSVELKWN